MTALETITVLIILVIAIKIYLNSQKNTSASELPASPTKNQADIQQSSVPTHTTETVSPVKTPSPKIDVSSVSAIESLTKLESSEASHIATLDNAESAHYSRLPQDSILRRHYLTHISSMLESLVTQRPTESVLCRHFDALLAARVEQCLSNENGLEQLFYDYENNKISAPAAMVEPLVNSQVQTPETSAPAVMRHPVPQDSILKRHYLTHLSSMIESLAAPRPTDSVLYRHYETLLGTKLIECLSDHEAIKQLVLDYENKR